MIATATRRIRKPKGSSYLTHGDDTYDKRGMNKARRALDKAIISEALEDTTDPTSTPSGHTTFRLVIITQIYENYGAHCWDGKDECPQYWKAKGGDEYHYALGNTNAVLALGHAGLCDLVRTLSKQCTRCDNYWDEYIIGWSVVPSTEQTQYEEWEMPIRHLTLPA